MKGIEIMLSLKPSEMSKGGGLWSDVDAQVTAVKFELTTFDGKVPQGVTALVLEVIDDAGEPHDQLLSCGKGVMPSADGKGLEEGGKFNNGSNAGLFLTSLVTAGFPESKIGDDISVLVGGKFHFERTAAPKRSGVQKAPRADGKVYEDTILIVTKVVTLPWDAKKGGGKAPGKAAPAKAPAAKGKAVVASDSGIEDEARDAIIMALAENNEVPKQQLAANVFKVVAGSTNKAAIVKMIYQEGFLESIEGVTVDNGVVSM